MKAVFYVFLCVIGFVAAYGLLGGFNTAAEVADKTVFNSDKIIYSYEQFHKKYENYNQYGKQLAEAQARMDTLKAEGIRSGQEYDNLANEITGIRQMRNRIASDYNAMSEIYWDNLWKSKGLPDKLE